MKIPIIILFVIGFLLTSAFSINDASAATTFVDVFLVQFEEPIPTGLAFSDDGLKLFVVGNSNDSVFEYPCTVGFDISTCTAVGVSTFVVSGQDTTPTGLAFSDDGLKLFVIGAGNDNVNEYPCTAAFDISTCTTVGVSTFDVSGQDILPQGLAFSDDGLKLFVIGSGNVNVNEYPCTTGFDISTCTTVGVSTFDVSGQETGPTGLAFNIDGTKLFVVGSSGMDVNEYTLEVGFDFDGVPGTSSDCYDCTPPVLQNAHIIISSNDYVVATGDDPIHITANVGDKVTVTLKVTDDKSVDTIPFAALYTNYEEKPDSMNAFYANNYDNLKQVSTSFYEWNVRSDDVAYDYDETVSWNQMVPQIVTEDTTDENYFMKNDNNVLEYFMMPFTFTMNDSMETSQIIVKIYDNSFNMLYVTLPVTLEIIQKETVILSDAEEIATLDKGDVIVTPSEDTVPLLNEPVLLTVLSQWSGYSQVTSDDAEVLSVIGLQGESLPAWTKNLGEWVIQEKLDVSELITAINYVHNNQ